MEKGQSSPADTSDARGLVASLPRHWERRSRSLQSVPFLPSRSEPPDLQGLHHSAREPLFLTPSACPEPSQRKTSCAGPEPRTRGQQSTSLQGPLPLCCSPQLKHLESSRVLEGSSISGLHRRPFPKGVSPEIKLGKETRSFSSSSCLLKGKSSTQGFSLPSRSLSPGHAASQVCTLQCKAGWWHPVPSTCGGAGRHVLGVRTVGSGAWCKFVGEVRTEPVLLKMT